MATAADVMKRVILGRQVASHRLEHTLLPKVLALPVFSSDALSSVAYATEEILHVLVPLSLAAALSLTFPISVAIAVVMVIVVTSYRQTVRAYPSGGGAYIVSKDNLGTMPGLIAAAALLTDYVLTVSVSVAAGVFAITSALPELGALRVPLALGFVFLVTLANLRGVRESGTLFAIPTYGFILSIFAMLAVGLTRCLAAECPEAVVEQGIAPGAGAVTLVAVLRAFSSGSTALTGVEAISNGVPAFRRPQSKNAAATLAMMGTIAITMFLGISWLATHTGARPSENQSMVSQIAGAVFGEGSLGFYVVQVTTAAILVLAANTAYQDFPRLSAILARDRFVPRQFENRGDRLVFSNGILVLALLASILIWVFDADVSRLIQLYVVGVFTSFTLSQSGMVRHWLRHREPGWRRSILINAVGAVATGVVLVVIASTKFIHGAWIVIAAIPVIVGLLWGIHSHYQTVRRRLHSGSVRVGDVGENRVVLVITEFDAAAAEALGYVRSFRPREFHPVYVGERPQQEVEMLWEAVCRGSGPRITFLGPGGAGTILRFLRGLRREPNDFVTVVIPELFRKRSLLHAALARRLTFWLKVRLLSQPNVVISNVPVLREGTQLVGVSARPLIPTRVDALVFVGDVNDAVVRAVNYALSLDATETRAVYVALEPGEDLDEKLRSWSEYRMPVPLQIVEGPFRDLGPPVLEEVRRVTADGRAVAAVVIPEFLVTRWWHRVFHNNRGLFIKRLLLFEPRVILSSVPYSLGL